MEGAIELNRQENGEAAGVELATSFKLGAASPQRLAVAVADGRVVSALVLLDMRLSVGEEPAVISVGQPEFVATAPDFRNRGLVRSLLGLAHRWSAERGDLLQLIGGIPFFYRQFGYQYGLVRPRERLIPPEVAIGSSSGWNVRPAVAADIEALRGLQHAAQTCADVRLPWSPEVWPVLIALPHGEVAVAVHEGVVRGVAYLRGDPGDAVHVQGFAADGVDAARSLLLRARARGPGASLIVQEPAGLPLSLVVDRGTLTVARRKWLYLRVADPVAVLQALRPVLSRRLSESPLGDGAGAAVLSFYRAAARVEYREGEVVSVTSCPPVQDPAEEGAAGVPPDLTSLLFFGEDGIAGIEDHPDVELGPHRTLLETLFPPQRVDAMIW